MKSNVLKLAALKALVLFFSIVFMGSCEKEESVEDDTPILSSKKEITAFTLLNTSGTINSSNKTISFYLPINTNLTSLSPTIAISDKAEISPASAISQDFSNPFVYTVTAEDGSTQEYTVSVGTISDLIHSFTSNNKDYDIVLINKTWVEAAKMASDLGGYLAEINDKAENDALYDEAINNAGIVLSATIAEDGGGASYLWLGANDIITEGTWIWNGNNDDQSTQFWLGKSDGTPINGLYSNWGTEPDDYQSSQDALALALTEWPVGSGHLGSSKQWNDVYDGNKLFFIIEYDK